MYRNLLLTGGHSHAFATAAPALATLLGEHGIESTVSDDIDAALSRLDDTTDLITVYALRWSMSQSEKYAPYRERWAYRLSEHSRSVIEAHLARGGGLLALHTALICFDDWPRWKSILGGGWRWGYSAHPPYGPVHVRAAQEDHPLLDGVRDFTVHDEVYAGLGLRADVKPLLHARAGDEGDWQPVLWTRRIGDGVSEFRSQSHAARENDGVEAKTQTSCGRVAVDALGHDAEALQHPSHRTIVVRAALWACGASEDAIRGVSIDPADAERRA